MPVETISGRLVAAQAWIRSSQGSSYEATFRKSTYGASRSTASRSKGVQPNFSPASRAAAESSGRKRRGSSQRRRRAMAWG